VLVVLEARGIAVSDEVRDRVLACRDIEQLGRWVARAAVATTVGEVFVE